MKYHVYIYIHPVKKDVIYVGMGQKQRYLSHWRYGSDNNYLNKILNKLKRHNLIPIIKKIYNTNNQSEAYNLEKFLISFYGRRDRKQGTLCNFTDGGELEIGRIMPRGTNHWNYGNIVTDEVKNKIRKTLLGKYVGIKHDSSKCIMYYGNVYQSITEASLFFNITISAFSVRMRNAIKNKQPDCRYITKEEYHIYKNNTSKIGSYKWNNISKMIIINNQIYTSMTQACKLEKISFKTLKNRLNNPLFNYRYLSLNEYNEILKNKTDLLYIDGDLV